MMDHARPPWRLAAGYVATAAVAHLLWEIVQLPLYTIWQLGTGRQLVVAVLHCTGGDVLITAVTLAIAADVARLCGWPPFGIRMMGATIAFGLAYMVFSEWVNVMVWRSWAYEAAMPVVPPLGTGLAPLLQWLVVPSLAFLMVRNPRERRRNIPPFPPRGSCASVTSRGK